MVPKVMICATFSRPYFLRDVFDQFAASPHAKVDVDIGHGNAFGIQEAFEEQLYCKGSTSVMRRA